MAADIGVGGSTKVIMQGMCMGLNADNAGKLSPNEAARLTRLSAELAQTRQRIDRADDIISNDSERHSEDINKSLGNKTKSDSYKEIFQSIQSLKEEVAVAETDSAKYLEELANIQKDFVHLLQSFGVDLNPAELRQAVGSFDTTSSRLTSDVNNHINKLQILLTDFAQKRSSICGPSNEIEQSTRRNINLMSSPSAATLRR